MNKKVKGLMETIGGEWKPVKGYEGLYWVNHEGRVVSKAGNELKPQIKSGAELKSRNDKYKMAYIHLIKNCHNKQIRRSKMVAEAFLPNPQNLPQVDHIDQNPLNDHIDNLRWVSAKENCLNKDNSTISKKTHKTIKKNREEFLAGNLEGEEWKWIDENTDIFRPNRWESGRYLVSNYGRIKDIQKQTMVAQHKNASGYLVCSLTKYNNNKVSNQYLHRIVAMLFCEGRTRSCDTVSHIDDNKSNIRADNLEWITNNENVRRAFTTGANKSGEKLGIPIVQLTLEGEFVAEFKNSYEAGRAGFSNSHIIHCLRGRQKSAYGYRWLYKEDYENGNFIQLTEKEIKMIQNGMKYGGIGGKTVGERRIINAKYNTEDFKHAVNMYKTGLWSSTKACQHAGYNHTGDFRRAIYRAIEVGVLGGVYKDYVK